MRAYLIDPTARTVTEVEHDGSLESVYRLTNSACVAAARFNRLGDFVYVDEDASAQPSDFFTIPGLPEPLAGRGLVLGGGADGQDAEPAVSLAELREVVGFASLYGGIAEVVVPPHPLAAELCKLQVGALR